MRFKFCGDLDTPDWVLSKILLISKLINNDLKSISNEVVSEILDEQFNKFNQICKRLEAYKFKEVDCKGIIAALTFIFKSSAKYTCDHDILSRELQQLGLHKDGAQILSRIYQLKLKDLRCKLEQNSFRVNKLSNVNWTLKRTSDTNTMQSDIPLIELNLELDENGKNDRKSVVLTVDKLLVLSEELKRIKKTIQRINTEL